MKQSLEEAVAVSMTYRPCLLARLVGRFDHRTAVADYHGR